MVCSAAVESLELYDLSRELVGVASESGRGCWVGMWEEVIIAASLAVSSGSKSRVWSKHDLFRNID